VAEVELIGADRLIARLVKVANALDPGAARVLKTVAENTRDTAKELCPVDTGSLQRSIRVQVHARPAGHVHSVGISAGGYVTNPRTGRKVDYAVHVEYGTSRTPAQPFMRPAVEQHKKELQKRMKEVVKR